MRRQFTKGRIQPKISTMPRQKSEAAAFLDIYKLVIEKRRLQQELQSLDQRRQQICDRLSVLESQVDRLETQAHYLRDSGGIERSKRNVRAIELEPSGEFDLLLLEY
jgi:predicted  nucleic acid-binding Zn-ribbon protein